jgi:hypothetical protein
MARRPETLAMLAMLAMLLFDGAQKQWQHDDTK